MAPTAAFFVALALDRCVLLVEKAVRNPRGALAFATPMLALGLALGSARSYFLDYTPLMSYGSYNGLVATELGKHLRGLETGSTFVLLGPPRLYHDFGSITYLAPNVPGVDLRDKLQQPIAAQPSAGRLLFVLLPERLNELQWIQATYPTGTRTDFPSPLRPEPLFVVWEPSG
jgi:energy-converting hydrogenase Eha subunit A